jgi:hypothetical protein
VKPLIAKVGAEYACVSEDGCGWGDAPIVAFRDYERSRDYQAWLHSDSYLRTPLAQCFRRSDAFVGARQRS